MIYEISPSKICEIIEIQKIQNIFETPLKSLTVSKSYNNKLSHKISIITKI